MSAARVIELPSSEQHRRGGGLTLMSTGARRFWRSFLCTHRKLISTVLSAASRTRSRAGTPVMNATSLPLPVQGSGFLGLRAAQR